MSTPRLQFNRSLIPKLHECDVDGQTRWELGPILDGIMRPIKRSLTICGHQTSVSLEPEFWDDLKVIAQGRDCSLASLITQIDALRGDDDCGLSSAIRLFIVAYWKDRAGYPTPSSIGKVSRSQ